MVNAVTDNDHMVRNTSLFLTRNSTAHTVMRGLLSCVLSTSHLSEVYRHVPAYREINYHVVITHQMPKLLRAKVDGSAMLSILRAIGRILGLTAEDHCTSTRVSKVRGLS